MLYLPSIISIMEVLIVVVPALLTVAFVTVAERKTMASMQRRLGPNIVGYYGLLQAFADALKLLLKEYVSPTQANLVLFFLGPIITLIFALLGYAVVPFGPGLAVSDFNLGILYLLAVSSLTTYGILLAGWSANSKYAFLGSLRSTAQLVSYELVLSSAILIIILLSNSLNLTINMEWQKAVWFVLPLFPIFCIFFIGSIAETNRAPFDLVEAESELVSGFMTEHSAVIFVFFFLAEYASIVLMCILICILFFAGYNFNYFYLNYIVELIYNIITETIIFIYILSHYIFSILTLNTFNVNMFQDYYHILGEYDTTYLEELFKIILSENSVNSFIIGLKSSILIFIFIWVRASFPRIRYDQLMSYCWTVLLPLLFAFIIVIPCILYVFDIITSNGLFY